MAQPPPTTAPAKVGQVLRGKWRLDALLGVGGMACVYAATHRNGMRGAVKILHIEHSLDPATRARFLREGYLANKVDHPGAVRVLDDDVDEDGSVFLVMELLEGETLDARLHARPDRVFTVREVLDIADQVLDVLKRAHEEGIVHRDIKPENLFMTKTGDLKVLDFGIARLNEARSTHSTSVGHLLGTPAFMPPEQALGNWSEVDHRTDLWAVGATMFRLLTGRPVHEAESIHKLLLAAMTEPAPPIARVLPTVPHEIAALVDRALAFDKHDRWPDARAMQAVVRGLMIEPATQLLGAQPSPTGAAPPARASSPAVAERRPTPTSATELLPQPALPSAGPPLAASGAWVAAPPASANVATADAPKVASHAAPGMARAEPGPALALDPVGAHQTASAVSRDSTLRGSRTSSPRAVAWAIGIGVGLGVVGIVGAVALIDRRPATVESGVNGVKGVPASASASADSTATAAPTSPTASTSAEPPPPQSDSAEPAAAPSPPPSATASAALESSGTPSGAKPPSKPSKGAFDTRKW